MDIEAARAVAEEFLRASLAAATAEADGFTLALDAVIVSKPGTLKACFVSDIPFRPGDHRLPDRVNQCLGALVAEHPAIKAFRLDVGVAHRAHET